jgi:cytochrome c biogenesis protein CcmG/thiol:disulfide interchange protein DsbE
VVLSLVLTTAYFGFVCVSRAQSSKGEYDDSMEKGRQLLTSGKLDDAIKEFKTAIKVSDGKEYLAYWGLAQTYFRLDAVKNVSDTCKKIIEIAPNDHVRAEAYNLNGIALLRASDGNKKQLSEAETLLRKALETDPNLRVAHYNLGKTLLVEGHDSEGRDEMKAYLAAWADGPDAANAKKYIASPNCAREECSNEFSFTSAKGEYISSDDLRGKIVVVDFWATWCEPCRNAFPALQYIYKRSDKEKVVLISVSEDNNERAWRAFLDKYHPDWTEVRDASGKLRRLLAPNSTGIPTYLVIDSGGIVRKRYTGWSSSQDEQIEDDIKKLSKTVASAPKAQ